jgi:hypothetical protein
MRNRLVRAEVPSLSLEWLLAVRWQSLEQSELARHVRRLIVAERKCIAGEFPRHVAPRLRWRRLAAARRLVSLGAAVNSRVFRQPNARAWSTGERLPNIPQRYSWAGVFTLVPLSADVT